MEKAKNFLHSIRETIKKKSKEYIANHKKKKNDNTLNHQKNKDNNVNHKENKDNNENHQENKESVQKSKEELEQEAKIVYIAEQSMKGIYEPEKSEQLFLNSKDNMLKYLKILNKNRSKLIDLNESQYTAIKAIFTLFINQLNSEIPTPDQENELFYEIMEYILILSQTFYHIENTTNKREIMQDELKYLDIWENVDLWLFLIYKHVDSEVTRQKISSVTNLEERELKAKAIYSSTVTTYEFNMISSGLKEPFIQKIKGICKKKYNLSSEDVPDLHL